MTLSWNASSRASSVVLTFTNGFSTVSSTSAASMSPVTSSSRRHEAAPSMVPARAPDAPKPRSPRGVRSPAPKKGETGHARFPLPRATSYEGSDARGKKISAGVTGRFFVAAFFYDWTFTDEHTAKCRPLMRRNFGCLRRRANQTRRAVPRRRGSRAFDVHVQVRPTKNTQHTTRYVLCASTFVFRVLVRRRRRTDIRPPPTSRAATRGPSSHPPTPAPAFAPTSSSRRASTGACSF